VTDRVYSVLLAVLVLMRILLNMNFVVQFPELSDMLPHAPFGYWYIQWVGVFAVMTGVVRWNHIAFLYSGAAFVVVHVVLGSLCLASVIVSNSDELHNFILPCLSIYLAFDVPILALYTSVVLEQHHLVSPVWRHAIWDWFARLLCRAHPRAAQGSLDDPTPVPPFRFSSRMLASAMFTVFFAGVAVYRWQASLFRLVQLILDQQYVVEFRQLHNVYSDMLESALSLLSQASNTACVMCILIAVCYQLLLLRSFRRDVELALHQPHDDHVQKVLMHASISKSPLFVMCTSAPMCNLCLEFMCEWRVCRSCADVLRACNRLLSTDNMASGMFMSYQYHVIWTIGHIAIGSPSIRGYLWQLVNDNMAHYSALTFAGMA